MDMDGIEKALNDTKRFVEELDQLIQLNGDGKIVHRANGLLYGMSNRLNIITEKTGLRNDMAHKRHLE